MFDRININIDINAAPPTDLDIQRVQQAAKRRHNLWLGIGLISFAVYMGGAFAYVDHHIDGAGWAWLVGLFGCVTAGTLLFWGVGDSSEVDPVAADKCARLLALLESTPEGQRYRDAVVAQGRQFVQAELWALERRAKAAAESAACRTLYRLPAVA